MARPKKLLTEFDIATLNTITKGDSTAAIGYRLAAVRAYVSHSANEVASFFQTEPETVIRWASKYHSFGLEGLTNKKRGHRRKKLSPSAQDTIRAWLEKDVDSKGNHVHWTLKRMTIEIADTMGIEISVAALGATLQKMGMAITRPRPMHYNSSPELREEVKKKSTDNASGN